MVGAHRACRRRKRGTRNAQRYEMHLLDNLVDTAQALTGRTWRPSRTVAFVVTRPKAREILAADFSDRVVHHLLVPHLETHFEPVFIDDSFSNRQGKGTHAAVDRLQVFLRQVSANGCRPEHYLQLDVANFFNCIDRRRLFGMIRTRLEKDMRRPEAAARYVAPARAADLLWLTRVLLTGNAAEGAHRRGTPGEFARVPPHKRLGNAPAEKGLPIGNLTSQFFANVYLNELDQYVKHVLKCRHYVRYVDDFVLLHENPQQLESWRESIAAFLKSRLELELRDAGKLRPVGDGIDFLGYIVRRDYRLVRRRVVGHLHERLRRAERIIQTSPCRGGREGVETLSSHCSTPILTFPLQGGRNGHGSNGQSGIMRGDLPAGMVESLRSTLASYLGHFRHAHSHRLVTALWRRYPWLGLLFGCDPANRKLRCLNPRGVASLRGQWRYFCRCFPGAVVFMRVGNRIEAYGPHVGRIEALPNHGGQVVTTRAGLAPALAWKPEQAGALRRRLTRAGMDWVETAESGWLKGGLKRRVLGRWSVTAATV